MSTYIESTVTGQVWTRCNQIAIDNRRGSTPTVRFEEERVAVLDDGDEMRKPAAGITLDFDPARVIPLLNPSTGQPTGDETTYGAVYAILYSAYIAAAQERDARNNPPPPAEQPAAPAPAPAADTKPAQE
jgi:hypothetical protein